MRHRNPYLILGIPFGSSRDTANIAFARKARPLRRLGNAGRDQLTELTWALNQIDVGIRHPDAEMGIYRVPADPDAFAGGGAGVLNPPAEQLPARDGDRDAAVSRLQAAAAHEYLRYLVLLRSGQVELPQP
jgi:hypothetical protein